jgi:hypothetical protein
MSKLQINNLKPSGAELFQGSESFLTELKATEAHSILGGKSGKSKKSKKSGSGKSKKSGSGGNSGGGSYGCYNYCYTPTYYCY